MKTLFVYGTLTHIPLLEIVLGRGSDAGRITPATMPDFASYWVLGQAYPMITAQQGAAAAGLLLTNLTDQDLARLDFYEGGFDYTLKPVVVKTKSGDEPAEVYFPDQEPARGLAWNLVDWQAEWGAMTVRAAQEVMSYYGQITPQDLAQRFGSIRRRAASYVRAQAETVRAAAYSRADVTTVQKRIPYSHFYTVEEYDLQHRQFSGKTSPEMERAVFVACDVAIVLPYDPVRDCVLLVEQFRIGAYARGGNQPWLLEPVAGHVDIGETPAQAARRETLEEAGVNLTSVIPISQAYPSPGDSTEYYHIYLGLCDLDGAGGTVAGILSEDEDILCHIMSFEALMDLVENGGANVLPLVTAAYWLARNRDRLRQDT